MKWKVKLAWFVFGIILVLVGIIPVRIAIAFHQVPVPQAIFVLGGNGSRMEFAAQFWQSHRNLDIWVSDFESNLNYNRLIFEKFGVFCTETENGLRVKKQMNIVPDGLEVDFTDIPDAFPLVFACCVAHQVNAEFTGIKNLKFKESDRVSAMIDNLLPLGLKVMEQSEDTIRIDSSEIKTLETYHFKSYSDHRIAMACSLFVLKGNIVIDNERVVNKSFPDYWQVLETIGIRE